MLCGRAIHVAQRNVLQAASPHYACRRSCICIRRARLTGFYRSLTYAARRRRVKNNPASDMGRSDSRRQHTSKPPSPPPPPPQQQQSPAGGVIDRVPHPWSCCTALCGNDIFSYVCMRLRYCTRKYSLLPVLRISHFAVRARLAVRLIIPHSVAILQPPAFSKNLGIS